MRQKFAHLMILLLWLAGPSITAQAVSASRAYATWAGTSGAIDWRAGRTVPSNVTETYTYDEPSDTVIVSVVFNGTGYAALPPMLALAYKYGFPITFDKTITDSGQLSPLGPLMGVANTDRYEYRIHGLGKYVLGSMSLGSGSPPPPLASELELKVSNMIAAGHLTPWLYLLHLPSGGFLGNVLWHHPGEVLYLLAEIAPALSSTARQNLANYLRQEMTANPPDQTWSMSFTQGAQRTVSAVSGTTLGDWQNTVLAYDTQGTPKMWNLYGLSRAYDLLGDAVPSAVFTNCTSILNTELQYQDWATLYWLNGHTPHFNAVEGVNQEFAGFVGYIRLARRYGDKTQEALGWGQLARLAVLRYAMGKYAQFMHDAHLFNVNYIDGYWLWNYNKTDGNTVIYPIRVETDPAMYTIPADPAWWVKKRAGFWHGELLTWNWSTAQNGAQDDVRQVDRLDETGTDVWEYGTTDVNCCGMVGNGQQRTTDAGQWFYKVNDPHLLPFSQMTPEMGVFLKDYLRPESDKFCQRVLENQPHWYAAYAEEILVFEQNYMSPTNSYSQFLARAWILGENPSTLEKYVDVPWLAVGDLFYLHKLAETIKAYRGAVWQAPGLVAPAAPKGFRKR